MHRVLSDRDIRRTCRQLLANQPRVTGRQLRRVLKDHYESVGNTERIFKIWREESAAHAEQGRAVPVPVDIQQLLARLAAAEATAEEQRRRAERAELREEAHQDRWALEIDTLRQQIRNQPNYAAEIRSLQDQVLRLTVQLHAARRRLAEENSSVSVEIRPSSEPKQP